MANWYIFLAIIVSCSAQQNHGAFIDDRNGVLAPNDVVKPAMTDVAESKLEELEEEELGFIDTVFGRGTQERILNSIQNWIGDKARANPGCVERFICETYRTGENMNGFAYIAMAMTNAAVSFMVAELFDQSIDVSEITRAARYGRTIGTCHSMKCEFVDDGQLRTLGDYLSSVEDFMSTLINSVSNSINLG